MLESERHFHLLIRQKELEPKKEERRQSPVIEAAKELESVEGLLPRSMVLGAGKWERIHGRVHGLPHTSPSGGQKGTKRMRVWCVCERE